jgi:SAM-dependent methyltransferase
MKKSLLKKRVRWFWENNPCGAGDVPVEEGGEAFFHALREWRYGGDDFMFDAVGFERTRGMELLEVGCGPGTDLVQFASHGATVTGLDLTVKGIRLARANLAIHGQTGQVLVGDAERLPFSDDSFDFVYSWGVIHHTPETEQAAQEIVRVCRPGGRVLVMLYNRNSLVTLQAWIVYGLLRGQPLRSRSRLVAEYVESPGTRVFNRREGAALFPLLSIERVQTIVTRWDLRLGRRRFLPPWLRRIIPQRWGHFMIVEGVKR